MCSKRCNSNDATSMFETRVRELRATLLSNLSSRGLRGLTVGPDCGARGRRRGPAGSCPAPPDWRPPRGLRGLAGSFPAPPDWRPPRGLRGLAGLRDDAPSEARSADGERSSQRGRRAKLAARTASGRAGLAAAGDLAATGNRAAAGDLAATGNRAAVGDQAATQSDKKVVAPRKTWGPPLMRSLT